MMQRNIATVNAVGATFAEAPNFPVSPGNTRSNSRATPKSDRKSFLISRLESFSGFGKPGVIRFATGKQTT